MKKGKANSGFTAEGPNSRVINIPEPYQALENSESYNDSSFKIMKNKVATTDQSMGGLFGQMMQDEISKAITPEDINELDNFATDNKI